MEPTNAALMVIPTEFGFFPIDPLEDTFTEASRVRHLWKGQPSIDVLRSRGIQDGVEIEIWFVSLDCLIEIHPEMTWLQNTRAILRERVQRDGFEADTWCTCALANPYGKLATYYFTNQ
jgi:hypothetical protein